MRRILTALSITALAVVFVACGVKVNPPPPPGAGGGPGAGKPVVISAAQLAQEFYDNVAGAKYQLQPLEVSGVVTRLEKPNAWEKEPGPDDATDSVVFIIPVTNKATKQQVNYTIRCLLQPQVSAEQRKALGLASGKPVVLRGKILASDLNNPQASLQQCTIVSAGGQ